ncbi:unnamed protein product [Rangifer tarandus platyrhynchus]|uniref:Uncharacterized protein n=1 Tax=Rangifer tarandus platyrhynchus TaxID=3082113 RepID=A0AC59Y410_RANTA
MSLSDLRNYRHSVASYSPERPWTLVGPEMGDMREPVLEAFSSRGCLFREEPAGGSGEAHRGPGSWASAGVSRPLRSSEAPLPAPLFAFAQALAGPGCCPRRSRSAIYPGALESSGGSARPAAGSAHQEQPEFALSGEAGAPENPEPGFCGARLGTPTPRLPDPGQRPPRRTARVS